MPYNRMQKFCIFGGCMFIFSILYQTAILPATMRSQVRKKVALKTGWMMRDMWGKYPFTFGFQIYVFNITNPEEIKAGSKPIVQEIGPFVYDEWHEKTNQIDHEEDDTVSYTLKRTFYFNTEKSNGLTSDEEVIIPHLFMLGTVNAVLRDKPSVVPIINKAIDSIMRKPSSIFIKTKVRNFLFDGLTIDCNVGDFTGMAVCNDIAENYEEYRLKSLGDKIYATSMFGLLNGTDSKERTRVKRGLKSLKELGTVTDYNNKKNISIWGTDYCDTLRGSDGTIFHPFFDKKGKDDIVAFNPGICRSVTCNYESDSKVAGVKTLRYTTDLGTHPKKNSEQQCYCIEPSRCPKFGVMDLFKCINAPIFISNPHFYLADPYYVSAVDGVKPIKEKHMFIIDIDAFTGIPMEVYARAQLNMFIMKVEKFKLMKTFPEALIPLLWFEQSIILPDFIVKEVKSGHRLARVGKAFQYIFMIVGLTSGAYGVYLHVKSRQAEKAQGKTTKAPIDMNSESDDNKMHISTIRPAQVPASID